MKKHLFMKLLIGLLLLSNYCLGQLPYTYTKGILTVKHVNGADVEKQLTFAFSQNDYDLVSKSERFLKWESEMFSKYAGPNRAWAMDHKDWDRVIAYVKSNIGMSFHYTKMKLKNANSFDFIEGSKGIIYSNNSALIISYSFKAQNNVGNFIISKARCIFSTKEEKYDPNVCEIE